MDRQGHRRFDDGAQRPIPSTGGALTHANYGSRSAKRTAKAPSKAPTSTGCTAHKDAGNTALFTQRIEAGVVAGPTWLMIRAMPREVRREYEDLEVETILFYPAKLVADGGAAYDALREALASDGTPWSSSIDMRRLRQVVVERSARTTPRCGSARKVGEEDFALRRKAREQFGKGSGSELAWKQAANTVYGVTACRHLATNNVVAANVVMATGAPWRSPCR